jgi:hypothetical protein
MTGQFWNLKPEAQVDQMIWIRIEAIEGIRL